MIEVKRQFPAPEILKRLAQALNVDTPELFSIPPINTGSLRKLHKTVLEDLQIRIARVVQETFSGHINELENDGEVPPKNNTI